MSIKNTKRNARSIYYIKCVTCAKVLNFDLYVKALLSRRVIPEMYLEPSRISTTEHFCENSSRLLAVNYFRKKAQS